MSPSSPLDRFLRTATQAARQAGAILAAHVGKPATVETKRSAIDLVTDLDRASEDLIPRILLKAFPDHGFYGEERPRLRQDAPYQWIVDPLDGTTNFVHGLPLFGISIGLAHHGTILVGVIYDPMRKELFTAAKGRGAFLNGKRIAVSPTRRLGQSLLSTGFASTFRERHHRYLSWFRAFEMRSQAVRRIGSTALSLADVAAGRLDGFYEQHLWPWDVAAGLLLIHEAGGRVTDFRGRPPKIEQGEVLASNGRIHRQMLNVLGGTTHRRRKTVGTARRRETSGAARRRLTGRR